MLRNLDIGCRDAKSCVSTLLTIEVCPKGRKHIGGGEAPACKKTKFIAPCGAAEIRNRYGLYIYVFGNTFCIQYEE